MPPAKHAKPATPAKKTAPASSRKSTGTALAPPKMSPAYRSKAAPKTVKRQTTVSRTRDPNTGLAQETRTTYENPYVATTRKPGQASAARRRGIGGGSGRNERFPSLDKSENIGLLQAEFFICLGVLVLIMFASKASNADKIMSTLKRGTLTCAAFFILALVASIGPNATKLSKAIGGLIVVALLLTAPILEVNKDVDNIIKNDWVASSTEATSQAQNSTNAENPLNNTASTDLGSFLQGIISGITGGATTGGTNAKAFAAGIIQGLKSVFGL